MSMGGNIDACPVTKETWEARAAIKQADCGGQSVYHCPSDSKGGKWERCVEKTKIIAGQCPIFTADGYIDWQPCNTTIPMCPNSTYVSNEVYKYPACFGNNTPKDADLGTNTGLIAGLVTAFVVIAIAALLIIVIMYRRRRGNTGSRKPEEQQPMITQVGVSHHQPVTEDIRVVQNALGTLTREKCVVILGKFGSSVSSTSLRILKAYVKENKDWKIIQCRYTEIPKVIDENTVMFVYGWFGIWNEDPCSMKNVTNACKSLVDILHEVAHVKIVIGMRSDLSKKYHQMLEHEAKELFDKEISLDTENEARYEEYKAYFKENIKDPCEKRICECQDLEFDMLSRGSHIGIPLKMNVLANFHDDVIPAYLIHRDLLKSFVEHLTALNNEKTKLIYQWIMYICLKGKFDRSNDFDAELCRNMGFVIEGSSFDEMYKNELGRYLKPRNSDEQNDVPPESTQYVFWHPFIYICAFHSLYEKDPEAVFMYCNIDAIVQLVRPNKAKKSYLEVSADIEKIGVFLERVQQQGIIEEYKNHPLIAPWIEAARMQEMQEMMAPMVRVGMRLAEQMLEPLKLNA